MYYKFHSVLSPAKLNLGLKITGKREDGYHLLKSIFCLINLFDIIDIQITENGKISLLEHNQAWFYQKDLSYKAAKLLQEYSNSTLGANIKIKKVIPSGAGMGGGSSNAATVLMVLNQLWQTNLTTDELSALGVKLGADIPFFIHGQNALVEGVGEIITPIKIPQLYFVIVKPSFHIPTKDIFQALDINLDVINKREITIEWLLSQKINDLEVPAKKIYPQLNDIFSELKQYGTPIMTGSGSSIYLTYNNENIAKDVAKKLESRYNTFLAASLPESTVSC